MTFPGYKGLLTATSLLALAACAPGTSPWTQEAGSVIESAGFGNATMNNTQIQNGDKHYIVGLNDRFSEEVQDVVTFAFDSAVLGPAAQAAVRQQAHWIRQFPEVRFRVFGHTDLVGSAEYNKQLGLRRANAVVNYLVANGVSRSRLEALVSFGETQPLIVTQGRERRNRRTVTEVSGFVGSAPLVLDGKYAQIIYREYVQSAVPTSGLTGVQQSAAGIGGTD
ncbi:OmpA family protein [Pseudooceanicola nanhaiensis]|jgi:outer membrane protein OmpA-like peptidoglycan-associated protein|uniref:Membrane protein n=1 Tax=Pseudooceanicola nanhaiensis TaxID=375761 RepID=A0A917WGW8_9RHOB|nr:OmpA family protein [Pseudooceanicola nanhaiensis]GGM02454.1 membrane protein [Pseudooceanicola nanhaiensis]